MNFDIVHDRRGTNSSKWDRMEKVFGVPLDDGIAMWIADMDFSAPDFLQDAVQKMHDRADYGYFTGMEDYYDAMVWWMGNRHGWQIKPEWISNTACIGNAIAMAIQTYTKRGDGVAIFTPVYHEFAIKINRLERQVVELPLAKVDGLYRMDFDAYEAALTGNEKLVIFCSPHNPAGRVWTTDEIRQVVTFCEKHDLLLVSDEIHQDLVYPGNTHVPTAVAAPHAAPRLITMASASKTFNIAGTRYGNSIIADPDLRRRYQATIAGLDLHPNMFGVAMAKAAYSKKGAQWVDELVAYLDENRKFFCEGINAIPGLKAMDMQATYLAWVDFSGTGMAYEDFSERVYGQARVAPSPGPDFGTGGENCLRFNIAAPRPVLAQAITRLQTAFADLQ